MASSRGKLVEGVDVFTDDEPKAKKAPTKRTPTAKKTASKSIAKQPEKNVSPGRPVTESEYNRNVRENRALGHQTGASYTAWVLHLRAMKLRFKSQGKRTDLSPNGEKFTWEGFCKDAGVPIRTADRWIKNMEDSLIDRGVELGHLPDFSAEDVDSMLALPAPVSEKPDETDEPEQEDDPNTIKMTREEYMKEQQDYQLKIREINKKKLDSANEKYKKALSDLEKLRKEGVGTAAEQKKLKKLQDEVAEMELRRNTLQVIDDATSIVADSSAALARLAAYDLSEDILEEREDDIKAMEAAIENMGEFVKEHLRV